MTGDTSSVVTPAMTSSSSRTPSAISCRWISASPVLSRASGRASEQTVRAVNVVRVEYYEAVHDHEVSPGRTVELAVVEQSLDPSDPTSASGAVASEQKMEREPETTSRGPFGHVQS